MDEESTGHESVRIEGLKDRLKVTVAQVDKGLRLSRSEYLYLSARKQEVSEAIIRQRRLLTRDREAYEEAR